MGRNENELAYWDDCARGVTTGGLTENLWKRQKIVGFLLEEDFWGKKILEIGCGAGLTAASIKNLYGPGLAYVGTDISNVFCEAARKFFRLKTIQCRASCIPFRSDEFDALMALDVLEHIHPGERKDVYAELNRVLKLKASVYINNPLSESKHDPEFDFPFSDIDLVEFAKALSMRIDRVTTYSVLEGRCRYQWVVLRRGWHG